MIALKPVAYVRGGRQAATDDDWDQVEAEIVLDEGWLTAEALMGLGDFSHIEVVYHFHGVPDEKVETTARHPRGRADWPKVGIFAQRGKNRPNRLGVTICRLLSAEGPKLRVRGLDAIDGTPVLDIKPYLTGFAPRGEIVEPGWAREIMAEYWSVG
ncbi:MAG TPA: SAM-dependent methyltransferase [Alphaproteobacteria bacterium]|jgi:tRNA-Thr(GGU) m(6)t(6)A37 methyltransferase TsaA|nr:SAM-dependent methyltransferase [Alphaproteobacteria bacterium]